MSIRAVRSTGKAIRVLDPVRSEPALIDQVHDQLVAAISSGQLEPGQRLTQERVAEMLGVSRQPVSHALQLLKHSGLVIEHGKRGLAVAPLDGERIRHLYQVREALDGLAARLAALRVQTGSAPEGDVKAFESALVQALEALDPTRLTVLEAESSKIGQINLPPSLFEAMKSAPRIEISADVDDRARYLVDAYSDICSDLAALSDRLDRLVRLQGRETVEDWKDMAAKGAHEALARELILRHYDPRYAKVRERAGGEVRLTFEAEALDEIGRAHLSERIAASINEL